MFIPILMKNDELAGVYNSGVSKILQSLNGDELEARNYVRTIIL